MADITLSSAVRANLNTLQQTASFMSDVQNKLATGKKVNSALDNPNSFFTASGLQSRANDLGTLLDDMGQSVQTIKAADEGISAITKLVESAKAKANQALQTGSQYERKQFAAQYNELLTQIEDVAKDSSYKGKNLLAGTGNDLTTIFNEDNTSKLSVSAVDYTDTTLSTGLNLSDLVEGTGGATNFDLRGGTAVINLTDGTTFLNSSSVLSTATAISTTADITGYAGTGGAAVSGTTTTAGQTVQNLVDNLNGVAGVRAEYDESTGNLTISSNNEFRLSDRAANSTTSSLTNIDTAAFSTTSTLVDSAGFKVGDTLTLTDGNNYELGSFEVTSSTKVSDLVDFIDDFQGVTASKGANGRISVTSETDLTLASTRDGATNTDFNTTTLGSNGSSATISAVADSGFATDNDINKSISRLNNALSNLRSQASNFGTNLSIVENRQDFTKNLINTLEEGAGKLTLADTNEEGANLLALQTRQSLASTSLSFASQADQNVLRLF
ncbi:flagellin [Labrenzia sp. PHM005]|uniref:flagellin N-terminal helical domain-containing protein n=1 Tax=Labrenzia sp. PHM005 TaxID=2590016 RepID=UPI0011407B77|nr:flagellin [Labrenzia sp. PHM005]QDG76805.1 ABC transporter substrate-binding protein [Labrenzia sp. PHM005]